MGSQIEYPNILRHTGDFDTYSDKCYTYTIDKKYSIDIDEELDFQIRGLEIEDRSILLKLGRQM